MPVITKITKQKHRANRRSVYLDCTFAFGYSLNAIARLWTSLTYFGLIYLYGCSSNIRPHNVKAATTQTTVLTAANRPVNAATTKPQDQFFLLLSKEQLGPPIIVPPSSDGTWDFDGHAVHASTTSAPSK